jgi:transcriptional regulator GlxA family with amidase domain
VKVSNISTPSRRDILTATALIGATSLVGYAHSAATAQDGASNRLPPPTAPVPVAFLLDDQATIIDFCGPWEVFQDAGVAGVPGFELFTVAPSTNPIRASGGMRIVPQYSLADAPPAKVIVIPAQGGGRDPTAARGKPQWLRERKPQTDLILSVCTGAFLLAQSGLLDGLVATTHHDFFDDFEKQFPKVTLARGKRYVENGSIMSAGGLTSGIDGALRVVERYYGREAALKTATYMEYESRSWISPAD